MFISQQLVQILELEFIEILCENLWYCLMFLSSISDNCIDIERTLWLAPIVLYPDKNLAYVFMYVYVC